MEMKATARSQFRGLTLAELERFVAQARATGATDNAAVRCEVNNRPAQQACTMEITWALPVKDEEEEPAPRPMPWTPDPAGSSC